MFFILASPLVSLMGKSPSIISLSPLSFLFSAIRSTRMGSPSSSLLTWAWFHFWSCVRGGKSLHYTHTAVLLDPIFRFRCSAGSGARRSSSTPYVCGTTRCYTGGTGSCLLPLHHLEVGAAFVFVAPSSSRPRGRLRHLLRQRLLWERNPRYRSTRVCFQYLLRYRITM